MLFNSYIFLFLFLPLCLAGCYLLEKKGWGTAAKVWLIVFSLWFYGYFTPQYLVIMGGSILVNFGFNRLLLYLQRKASGQKGKEAGAVRRAVLVSGVAANLGLLFYFKYYDFFIGNLNQMFDTSFTLRHIVLPLGISFFTFQQIGFLVDTYRGEVGSCPFVDYALFVSFFPQLVAGPIVSHEEMLLQFAGIGKRNWQEEPFVRGICLFVLGLAKKVLLADTFGRAVNLGYGDVAALNGTEALLLVFFYTFQLYFDFSGYCDMARGLGWMFGINIPENFDSPYQAVTIVDFWKRWHITLNRFLTKYVYIPLGGSRQGRAKLCRNILIVFFLSGLWHGAGWNFILWGMLHGVLFVLVRMAGEGIKKVPVWCSRIFTFLYVAVAWVYFRAESVAQGSQVLRKVFTGGFSLPREAMLQCFQLDEFWYVMKVAHLDGLPYSKGYLMALFLAAAAFFAFFCPHAGQWVKKCRLGIGSAVCMAVLFLWCVVSLSGVSTFLYFNF